MRAQLLVALAVAVAGCSTPYMRHPTFAAQYREAIAIAVLASGSFPDAAVPDDPASAARHPYAVVTRAIQEELESRRFEVTWGQETPETAAALAELSGRIEALLPRLLSAYAPPGADGPRPSTFPAGLGDTGLVLDTFSADLLLVVIVGGRQGQSTPLLTQVLGVIISSAIGLTYEPTPDVPARAYVHVLLVDRTGEVIFFTSLESDSDVYEPSQAAHLVRKALDPLPTR